MKERHDHGKRTISEAAGKAASTVLRDPARSKHAKTIAGSALSQSKSYGPIGIEKRVPGSSAQSGSKVSSR